MVALLGAGEIDTSAWPENPVGFIFSTLAEDRISTVGYSKGQARSGWRRKPAWCLIARSACERIFGGVPDSRRRVPAATVASGDRLVTSELPDAGTRAIDVAAGQGDRIIVRDLAAAAIQCAAGRGWPVADVLIGIANDPAARRLIEQRWQEKLTLNSIASACGLNRSKLARGFRDMFNSSVATVIAEQRLGEARQLLVSTELPISSIGYQCGYQNNAAFTRAFSRRHGMAPSNYRVSALAS